ncbi:MAG: hypothetical protein AB7F28_05855 [Candidatus Margulisiibacteriota bacterium]
MQKQIAFHQLSPKTVPPIPLSPPRSPAFQAEWEGPWDIVVTPTSAFPSLVSDLDLSGLETGRITPNPDAVALFVASLDADESSHAVALKEALDLLMSLTPNSFVPYAPVAIREAVSEVMLALTSLQPSAHADLVADCKTDLLELAQVGLERVFSTEIHATNADLFVPFYEVMMLGFSAYEVTQSSSQRARLLKVMISAGFLALKCVPFDEEKVGNDLVLGRVDGLLRKGLWALYEAIKADSSQPGEPGHRYFLLFADSVFRQLVTFQERQPLSQDVRVVLDDVVRLGFLDIEHQQIAVAVLAKDSAASGRLEDVMKAYAYLKEGLRLQTLTSVSNYLRFAVHRRVVDGLFQGEDDFCKKLILATEQKLEHDRTAFKNEADPKAFFYFRFFAALLFLVTGDGKTAGRFLQAIKRTDVESARLTALRGLAQRIVEVDSDKAYANRSKVLKALYDSVKAFYTGKPVFVDPKLGIKVTPQVRELYARSIMLYRYLQTRQEQPDVKFTNTITADTGQGLVSWCLFRVGRRLQETDKDYEARLRGLKGLTGQIKNELARLFVTGFIAGQLRLLAKAKEHQRQIDSDFGSFSALRNVKKWLRQVDYATLSPTDLDAKLKAFNNANLTQAIKATLDEKRGHLPIIPAARAVWNGLSSQFVLRSQRLCTYLALYFTDPSSRDVRALRDFYVDSELTARILINLLRELQFEKTLTEVFGGLLDQPVDAQSFQAATVQLMATLFPTDPNTFDKEIGRFHGPEQHWIGPAPWHLHCNFEADFGGSPLDGHVFIQ